MITEDDTTQSYGVQDSLKAELEEAIYLTRNAISTAQSNRHASEWLTREALDLLSRLCPW